MADNEDIDRRSREYQKAARESRAEFEKIGLKVKSTGEAMKYLSESVKRYAEAVRTGGSANAQFFGDEIKKIRDDYPRAWKKLGDSARQYKNVLSDVLADKKRGIAEIEDKLTKAQAGMVRFLGMSKSAAAAGAAGMSGRGTLSNFTQEIYSLREDLKLRSALKREGLDTSIIDERISQRSTALRAKAQASGKQTVAQTLQMKAVAESSSQGLTAALSKDAGAFGALAKSAVDSKGAVGTAMKSIMKQEALGAMGVATGGIAGAVGGGASAVIGSLAKALGPLSAAMTGAALISRVVIGVFEGMGNASRVAGHQMRAMAMNSKVDIGAFNLSMMGSQERIRKFAGITDTSGILVRSTFDKEIVPAAQKALLTFNTLDRSKGTIDNWAGAIAGAAVEGQAMGFSYEKSIGIITKLSGTFGNSAEKTRNGFRNIAHGARLASLTAEEFASSLGDMDDIARRLGSGGMGVIGAMGLRMASSGVQSGAQRQAMLGGVTGLMGDQSRLLGLGSAVFGPGMMDRYVGAHRAKDSGRAMADLTMSVLGGVGGGKAGTIGGMSPMQSLMSGNANQAFEASKLMEFATGMSSEAFLNQDFSKKYEKFLSGPQTKEEKFALEREAAGIAGDLTKQGMMSMIEQKSVLENILGAVNHIGNIIGAYAAGGIGAVVRGVDARTDEERISTKPPMDFSSGRRSR